MPVLTPSWEFGIAIVSAIAVVQGLVLHAHERWIAPRLRRETQQHAARLAWLPKRTEAMLTMNRATDAYTGALGSMLRLIKAASEYIEEDDGPTWEPWAPGEDMDISRQQVLQRFHELRTAHRETRTCWSNDEIRVLQARILEAADSATEWSRVTSSTETHRLMTNFEHLLAINDLTEQWHALAADELLRT